MEITLFTFLMNARISSSHLFLRGPRCGLCSHVSSREGPCASELTGLYPLLAPAALAPQDPEEDVRELFLSGILWETCMELNNFVETPWHHAVPVSMPVLKQGLKFWAPILKTQKGLEKKSNLNGTFLESLLRTLGSWNLPWIYHFQPDWS